MPFYSSDTSQRYAPRWFHDPTSESVHTRVNGIRFEKISVTSLIILHRSLLGSDYDQAVVNFRIVNVRIGGAVVPKQNKDEFFKIDYARVQGLSVAENECFPPRRL